MELPLGTITSIMNCHAFVAAEMLGDTFKVSSKSTNLPNHEELKGNLAKASTAEV